jgi:hypothetical protein
MVEEFRRPPEPGQQGQRYEMNELISDTTAVDAPAYEPPTLMLLGSVATVTLGNNGSRLDSNGRAAHGKL